MAPSARRPEASAGRGARLKPAAPAAKERPGGARRVAQTRRPSPLRDAVGALVMRNQAAVGGGAAFLIALSFITANAVWYQPFPHPGAFFPTRGPAASKAAVPKQSAQLPAERSAPVADPTLQRAQSALKGLGIYDGPVDGLSGPGTRRAIAAFQQSSGLPVSGELDAEVVGKLAAASATTASIAPQRQNDAKSADAGGGQSQVMKIQAGLKAFGNDGIEVDGVIGNRTRAALREFQSLFGLAVTGEPNGEVYAKMREIGLTD